MLIEQIKRKLDETGGNAVEVAKALSVSEGYVYRIKRENWLGATASPAEPERAIVEAPPAPLVECHEVLDRLAPNLLAVQNLRDLTLSELAKLINAGQLSHKEMVGVLRVLLKYEQNAEALARPALNLYDQRRQTNITVGDELMRQLSDMDHNQLRALAGVPEPPQVVEIKNGKVAVDIDDPIEIIDGELIHD